MGDTQKEINLGDAGRFSGYPHYPRAEWPGTEKFNLLAAQTAYEVKYNIDMLKDLLLTPDDTPKQEEPPHVGTLGLVSIALIESVIAIAMVVMLNKLWNKDVYGTNPALEPL